MFFFVKFNHVSIFLCLLLSYSGLFGQADCFTIESVGYDRGSTIEEDVIHLRGRVPEGCTDLRGIITYCGTGDKFQTVNISQNEDQDWVWEQSVRLGNLEQLACLSCGSTIRIEINKCYGTSVDCSGQSAYIEIPLRNCSEQECPEIKLDHQPIDCNEILEDGSYTVRFSGRIEGSQPSYDNLNYTLVAINTDTPPITTEINWSGTGPPFEFAFSKTFACAELNDQYRVYVMATGCNDAVVNSNISSFNFLDCECPLHQAIEVVHVEGCTYEFTLPIVDTCTVYSYNWSFGDTSPGVDIAKSNALTQRHSFSAAGVYTVTVDVEGNRDCVTQVQVKVDSGCADTDIEELNCSELQANVGDHCDDGNPATTNDKITSDCKCIGVTTPSTNSDGTTGDEGSGGTNGECDSIWQFWNCITFNPCWLLAFLLMIAVAARIVAIATGWGIEVNLPGLLSRTITLGEIATELTMLFGAFVLSICPCEAAIMMLVGAILGMIIILILLYYSNGSLPNWLMAIIVAVITAIIAVRAIQSMGC
ncbi:PKD domain-containing protein [Flavilitoribacter nigricans]|uniref:PKD domain-containing protein n=1 Tax=Flavilitoribacter nigricans (strain ATCC 23147 / DSM 23189 / NBRC 102662 / NCIMB 1420 / SS-2) TaxID=1122177 RepID=A0A2D0N0D4_FLAN2|nr:PKD domain-containing protein [Flavilitoribacter nigricans]PHN01974.1 hypothetical protein CRP01_34275 [Flavilitoribacter nigricans DSM 23189 = NBRC 102662]